MFKHFPDRLLLRWPVLAPFLKRGESFPIGIHGDEGWLHALGFCFCFSINRNAFIQTSDVAVQMPTVTYVRC